MDELETILSRLELLGWTLHLSCEPNQGWELSARVTHNAYSCSCNIDLMAAARDLEKNLKGRTPPPAYVPQACTPRPNFNPESLL